MPTSKIIVHQGLTGLLPKPDQDGGVAYPFTFQAVSPNDACWSFRVIRSLDPSFLTPEELEALIKGSGFKQLRAEWEELVGHRVGKLTIYGEAQDGTSGLFEAQYEMGREMEMPAPGKKEVQKPREPEPVDPEPIFDDGPGMDRF